MQVSKKNVNPVLDTQIRAMFFQMIADLKTPKEAEYVLKDIMMSTELSTLIKRIAIAYWLLNKRSYEVIKQSLKVSSATVATVAIDVRKPGFKLALQKITAEEWASKWEKRIKGLWKK